MRSNLAGKAARVEIVADELVPLMKVNDFAPYVRRSRPPDGFGSLDVRGTGLALLLGAAMAGVT